MNGKIISGDCKEELKIFEDNFFDLVIADPPYWKVAGEKWDYLWRTEDDYVKWSRTWFHEIYRT